MALIGRLLSVSYSTDIYIIAPRSSFSCEPGHSGLGRGFTRPIRKLGRP